MADTDKLRVESALNKLLEITEKSGNLRKDLRQDIIDSVSTLRSIFVNLRNTVEEKKTKINQLTVELNKAKSELEENREAKLLSGSMPSRGGKEQTTAIANHNQPTSSGGPKKLYSEAVRANEEKIYKLMVKSKSHLSTEEVKTTLRTNVNPTSMKVGIRSLKSLKDGRVLIEAGTTEEINKLRQTIQEKCGGDLEVVVPQLRKPRMVINNVPNEITVENLEEVIIAQNPELELAQGEMTTKFGYSTKRGQNKIVIEVGPETRKKLQQKKLKIGWQICYAADYLVAMRCFRCSRFNHRHNECKGEETCPLCSGGHKLKECKASADQHKCINCTTYNRYSKTGRINENHSSLDKNCPSLQAVLAKYRQNTEY
jgi:hypothetical protein